MKEEEYKLIQDHATIKEAFIIDELQAYMDLKDPSNPKWVQPVRVRLQEKKDWERKVREAIDKQIKEDLEGERFGWRIVLSNLEKELGLEDENDI